MTTIFAPSRVFITTVMIVWSFLLHTIGAAETPGKLTLKRTLHTGLYNHGCTVAVIGGQRIIFVTGPQGGPSGRSALIAMDTQGTELWRDEFAEDTGKIGMGAEPHVVDLGDGRMAVAQFIGQRGDGADELLRLLSPMDGKELWSATSGSRHTGNRHVTCVDLNGDGERELVVGYSDRLVCYRARDGAVKWTRKEGMGICWGRCAIADLNGDGKMEIVLGSEYGNADKTSSIFALKHDGSVLCEHKGIEGDCGSTPAYLADVDGDGTLEILKTEIDLEGRGPVHVARLWCLRADGSLLWRADVGGGDIVIGDINHDGVLESVNLTNGRDGGRNVPPAIRCVNLKTGKLLWETPLKRQWLTGWPVLFDVNGDGTPEVILTQGNPSGYGRRKGEKAWGEVQVVNGNGRILDCVQLPDWPLCPCVFDLDGDTTPELLVPCCDGNLYVFGSL